MHIRSLATYVSLGLLGVVAAAQEIILGTNSSRILYDKSWTDTGDIPKLKTSVNGSIYFFYGGGDVTVHYAPPKEGKMYLWIDGRTYFDLKAAATTAPQSPLSPNLKATTFQLQTSPHQIHITGSSNSTSDAFTFGGFTVKTDEAMERSTTWGAPQADNIEIIDNTAFTYSDGWEEAAEAPFSYNSTLMRTRTQGASMSYTFQKPYLQFWVYGTIGTEQSEVRASFPYHSGQVNSGLSSVHFAANDTLVQMMLAELRDWGTAGTFVNFTLEEKGTLAVDFIAVIYGEPPKPDQIVKIVVPVVVIGVVILAVAAFFIIRARKRKSTGQAEGKDEPYFFKGFTKTKSQEE